MVLISQIVQLDHYFLLVASEQRIDETNGGDGEVKSTTNSSKNICEPSTNNQAVKVTDSIGIYAKLYIDDLVRNNFWPETNDTNNAASASTEKVILDLLSKDETIKGMIINLDKIYVILNYF